MKKTFLLCCVALSLIANAQKAKPKATPPKNTTAAKSAATSSKLTNADAGKIISYNNSVREFLEKPYFGLSHTRSFYTEVINELAGPNNNHVFDPYKNGHEDFDKVYTKFLDEIKSRRQDLTDPLNPPAIIGAADVSFCKTKIEELKTAYAACYEQYKLVAPFFTENLDIRDKKKAKEAAEAIEKYKPFAQKVYDTEYEIYTKLSELGDRAEDVTLAKHPLKNEIKDIRKTMRTTQKIAAILDEEENPSVAYIESKETELKQLNAELEAMSDKYKNYKFSTQGNSNLGVLKDIVSSYFNNIVTPYLLPKMNTLLTKYKEPKAGIGRMKRDYLSSVESLYKHYENFVEYNNNGK